MRPPKQSEQLYHELKSAIECRRIIPGSQLSSEPELAEKYSVARNTLRKVLAVLEQEGLLKRVVGKGTFVREDVILPVIYFLVPSPDYMTLFNVYAVWTREFLQGAMVAAAEYNCRLEPLAVSPCNEAPMELQRLERLDANSMVVIPGLAYYPLFEFLMQKKCKVMLIQDQSRYVDLYSGKAKNWGRLEMKRRQGIHQCIQDLYNAGCRKTALAYSFISDETHPLREGYIEAVKDYQEPCFIDVKEAEKSELRSFYEREKFDSLVVDTRFITPMSHGSINELLGLPESVKVVIFNSCESLGHVENVFEKFKFSRLQMGYDAVRYLLSDEVVFRSYEPTVERSVKLQDQP